MPIRILFATPELAPWVKSGGLGDVSAALPDALRAEGADVRVLVPGYPALLEAFREVRAITALPPLGGALPPARLLEVERPGSVPVYLIDCPQYYARPGLAYQDAQGRDWDDNFLRFALLSRVAAWFGETQHPLAWRPHILNCHDWPTGLAPAYLHFSERSAATVMTVHNLAFQGIYDAKVLDAVGLPRAAYSIEGVEYYGSISFLKAGLFFADHLTTVSETYAAEIQTDALGCGLGGLLRRRRDRLTGILNGIDTVLWDPARDPLIEAHYDADHLAAKAVNKLALQRELGLRVAAEMPLLGCVSRLTHQKGVDLLAQCMPHIAALPAQLAILGTGEAALERAFSDLARDFPGLVATVTAFDERLAHRIESGADIYLMPSRFEPCGLNQMYSLRYGTPPVVRATGGLADTVVSLTPETAAAGTANGFSFEETDALALLRAVLQAIAAWRDPGLWTRMQRTGMAQDWSWRRSARKYLSLFRTLIPPDTSA
jgi:starch synthase